MQSVNATDIKNIYSLSPMQESMLFHYLLDQNSEAYFEQLTINLQGTIDIRVFEKSLQVLDERYDIFRTAFITEKIKQPLQVVLKERKIPLFYQEIAALESRDLKGSIETYQKKDRQKGFDLTNDPLVRVSIIKAGPENYVVIWSHHHILMDGWCIELIIKEFFQIYQSLIENKPLNLEKVHPYSEYIAWLQKQDKEQAGLYWRNYLANYEQTAGIPQGKPAHGHGMKAGYLQKNIDFTLDGVLTKKLAQMAIRYKVTVNTLFQSIWGILLQKYNNTGDVVFGSVVSGRQARIPGIETMVGLFINTIPVRIQAGEDDSFSTLIQNVQKTALESDKHSYLPLAEIQAGTELKQNLLDHIVVFENYPVEQEIMEIKMEALGLRIGQAAVFEQTNYDFNVIVGLGAELVVRLNFNGLRYQVGQIGRIEGHFKRIARTVALNPDILIRDIEILSEAEKRQILHEFNNTKIEYPQDKTIHELFEEQVARTPDNIALVFEGQRLTYRELNQKANQMARKLRDKGIKPNQIAAIMAEPSLEMITGIMGILKAGGTYLPIDPEYPEERIKYMLEDSGAGMLLTQNHLARKFLLKTELIDLNNEASYNADGSNVVLLNQPHDLAYIIYTSGSTGKPKGVKIEHHSLVNLCKWHIDYYQVSPEDRSTKFAGFGFDASVWEIFPYLIAGAALHIIGGELRLDAIKLNEYFEKNHITASFLPTQFCEQFMELDNRSLRVLLTGGDKLKYYQKRNYRLVNNYGPTENTVVTTSYIMDDEKYDNIPIGKPIANVRTYIVNRNNQLQPIGVPGELCISGNGLAAGYLNREELTAEKFGDNPYEPGTKMYRTGDLVQWIEDGNIQFLGRMDKQVKIRGFRIELGEIESRIIQHEAVREAAVIAREDLRGTQGTGGNQYLCAYIVAGPELTIPELRAFLAKELPDYMIPSHFVYLDKMPVNQSGKIDRKNLPAPEGSMGTGVEYMAPCNEIEETLAAIWRDVLGVELVGIHDNFFELGGHSLKATIVASRINKALNIELPLREVFKTPTIQELAQYIQKAESNIYSAIPPVAKQEYYPVSSAQKRLYIVAKLDETGTGYNIPGVMFIEGNLDRNRFAAVFAELVNRHETFRTSFEMASGEPVQRIHDQVEFAVSYREAAEVDLEQIVNEFIRPFDLSQAPLLRVGLIKINETRHVLLYDMHHIISDGTSMGILVREFTSLYQGQTLPELRIQYKDFAVWQNELFQSGYLKPQAEYWLDTFAGEVPVLGLPADFARAAVQSFEGDRVHFKLEPELAQKLSQLAGETGSTLYMLLLAAYNVLLAKYSGQEDIVVGSPIAGRPHADLEHIIGMFVNTLAIRNYPERNKTFRGFLAEVRENALKAYENQDYQFEELVEKLNLTRDISRNPLFDTVFVFQNLDYASAPMGDLRITPYEYENKIAKFDLTLTAAGDEQGIGLVLEYCTKLFTKATVERMAGHFTNLIRAVIQNPEIKLAEIEILSEREQHQILYEFNNPAAGYPETKTIQQLFEEQADRTPDQIALVFEDQSMTYRELNRKANQLARIIRDKGIQADSIVAMLVERSLEMVIGILAILKAGGAYLPINPDYPEERVNYMLEDSETALILTQSELRNNFRFTGEVIDITDESLYHGQSGNPEHINQPRDLAYIIYTSGTTGKPKGAMIEHRNVVRLLFNDSFQFAFDGRDVWTMFHSYGFDFSVWEMYGALLYGGKLVVVPKITAQDTQRFLTLLKQERVTILNQTPAAFYNLVHAEMKTVDRELKLKYVIFGGEALKPGMLKEWRQKYSETKLINMYGITETTVHVTYKEITEYEIDGNISNIGVPIPTLTTYIMDQQLRLQPVGVAGELCVGGAGVGRGYLRRPELTAAKFVANPYRPGERLYKSGDLAVVLPNGEMVYLGRIDHQVKIRGFRVELGEIESQLLKHAAVKEAMVIAKEDSGGNKYLCAYLVTDQELTIAELREFLGRELPDYMIPAYFVRLEKFPLTSNGKIDRKVLPEPEGNMLTGVEYVAPANEVETKLADIWRSVLGVEIVGVHDNFFALGGDSIKALQVSARLQNFGLKMDLKDLFQHPTVAELSNYVTPLMRQAYQGVVEGTVELTPIQQWFFEWQSIDRHYFNQSVMLYHQDGFNETIIRKVFDAIVTHHDALRMVYPSEAGRIIQYNRGKENTLYNMRVIDLRNEPNHETQITAIANELQAQFDLAGGPLVSIGLFKTSAGDHLLMILHHLVTDGVSWRILFEDIATCYEQAGQGMEIQLPVKTDSFKEWAEQLRKFAGSEVLQKEISFWKKFEDMTFQELPKDFPIQSNRFQDHHNVSIDLSEVETEQLLKQVNQAYHTEINDILLVALGLAVQEWAGVDQVLINLEGHGREAVVPDIDISRTVGWFTTIYPIVLDMSGAGDLAYRIKSIKESLRQIPGKGIGYGILKYLAPPELKAPLRFALEPEISFNYLGQLDQDVNTGIIEISPLSDGNPMSGNLARQYTFDINGNVAGGKLAITFSYHKDQYREETVRQLADSYRRNLLEIIKHCVAKTDSELTPSDLTYKGLDLQEMDEVLDDLFIKLGN